MLDDLVAFCVGVILVGAIVYVALIVGMIVLVIMVIVFLIWAGIIVHEAYKEVRKSHASSDS